MQYISLDLETSSLERDPNHILQVAMVLEDTTLSTPIEELPYWTCFVKHKEIVGQPYALAMNAWILDYVSGRKPDSPHQILAAGDWEKYACIWLNEHNQTGKAITVAGKNVGTFDLQFLSDSMRGMFKHRVLDPGSMFWTPTDAQVPGFEECLRRADINKIVSHDALEDARDVIRLIRAASRKSL